MADASKLYNTIQYDMVTSIIIVQVRHSQAQGAYQSVYELLSSVAFSIAHGILFIAHGFPSTVHVFHLYVVKSTLHAHSQI